jgi:hypothetical protein
MIKRLFLMTAFVMTAVMTMNFTASAHSIDYLTANISPAATFNGSSGNFELNSPVAPGTTITFDLTFSISANGNTTNFGSAGIPVTFGTTNDSTAASVSFSPSATCTFTSVASTCIRTVTVTAPSTDGNYYVKITPTEGTSNNRSGLSSGGGVKVSYSVFTQPTTPVCNPAGTQMTVDRVCALLRQTDPVALKATLLPNVEGKTVNFKVDGVAVGSATTDGNGTATLTQVDVRALSLGDHTIFASFDGDCEYEPTSGTNTLGITYGVVAFQQPINADGSSVFRSVKTIPVKIIVKDGLGNPVTDAQASLFFATFSNNILGTEMETVPLANTNNDTGNLMRLTDPSTGQYTFNWDTTGLANGTYRIRVGLGEGECGDTHAVSLSFKRK